ncbi:hypothetical protein [Streptomyces corynorhini]|uniref:Uncharacterized protein n=1 Tax=Streptomyces corynorhini TaxID=2282652 RepID=A0A370AZZ3_9ACTN|nr:hypothetical protein [Streptomyces corynorhini]RDG35150.1 hypothetical protein DVH02_26875 [Streptomyces corynorhini]
MTGDRSRTSYQASAAGLARRTLGALLGAGSTAMVAEHVERAADPGAALAAVRIIGADAFAPALLAGAALHARDAEAVRVALTALPASDHTPPAPPAGPEAAWLMAWRDWGTVTLLTVLTGRDTDGVTAARPTAPTAGGDGADWASWSVRMGQLCTLALPGLDGPVHEAARGAPLGLARGATRATLRRDYPTAARIVRWLAWLRAEGVALPLDPAPLVEHIAQMAAGDRTALDTAIARRLLAGPSAYEPSDRTGT